MTQDTEDHDNGEAPAAVTEAVDAVNAMADKGAGLADDAIRQATDMARDAQAGAFDMGEQSRTQLQTWSKATAGKGQAMLAGLHGKAEATRDSVASSFTATTAGLASFNVATQEALRANTNASFDLWTSLVGARTMSDVIAVHADHMRKQIDTIGEQTRTLSSLAQQIVGAMSETIRSSTQKAARPSV